MYRVLNVAVALGVVCAGCGTTKPSNLQVRTEYVKTVTWTEMKAFRVATESSQTAGATRYPGLERKAQEIVVNELVGRGYRRVEDGPTDFRVTVELMFRGDERPSIGDSPYGADGLPATAKGTGQVSTLIIRMLDPKTSQILWTGQVGGFRVDLVRPENELRQAVWRLLAEFPPLTG